MKVLVACEFSGVVRNAFLKKGHDVTSCDLIRLRNDSYSKHIVGDVRPLLTQEWDLVIAHPPCTYLSTVGVKYLIGDSERWDKMLEAALFFLDCLTANSPRICVENPIMHSYARKYIKWNPTQLIHPYQFGEPVKKRTGLWLKGLPKLIPTEIVIPTHRVMDNSSKNNLPAVRISGKRRYGSRGRIRSIFHKGIAEAMADQWS